METNKKTVLNGLDNSPSISMEEEIDLFKVILLLIKYKYVIVLGVIVSTLIGVCIALRSPFIYYSEATISPKEGGKSSGVPQLSQLGSLGGLISTQFGFGNTDVQKMKILLEGRESAETIIKQHDLLPILYPDQWDSISGTWNVQDSSEIPSMNSAIESLRQGILSVSADKVEGLVKVGINFYDPFLASCMVEYYLDVLNMRIQNDVKQESEINQQYLRKQMKNTSDPILQEKIQSMIAIEIEKSMLVAYQSFDILVKPYPSLEPVKPNRRMIVMVSFCAGIFLSSLGVFVWAFFSASYKRYSEEKKLKA